MAVVYNNLSDSLKKKLKWGEYPGRDEVVRFKLCYIPEIKQNGKMAPVFRNHRIPNTDTIYDSATKQYIQIAYVKRETGNKDNPYELNEIEFRRDGEGEISISGKEQSKFPMLDYMRACNYNGSNPLAIQPSNGFIFIELEPEKSAKAKVKERKEKAECENYIIEMKEAEIVAMLNALRLPVYPSYDENQESLLAFVEKKENRDKFLALSTDVRTPIAALISKAEKEEIIRFDSTTKIWTFVATKKPILQVPPQTDNYEALINYFHNDKHGKAFKDFLEKEMEAQYASESLEDAKEVLDKATKEAKPPKGNK